MISMVVLNINSVNDHTKWTTFIHWLHCLKADIVCLQEMHAASHATLWSWFSNSRYVVASSCISNKCAGMALLVTSRHHLDKVWWDDAGHFIQVKEGIGDQVLYFVSLYALNVNVACNKFFVSLLDLMNMCLPTFYVGILTRCWIWTSIAAIHDPFRGQLQTDPSKVSALQSLLSSMQAYPVWHSLHPGVCTYSWDHASGECSSRIDMIRALIGLKDQIENCDYYPSFFSDHWYIQVTFSLNSTS